MERTPDALLPLHRHVRLQHSEVQSAEEVNGGYLNLFSGLLNEQGMCPSAATQSLTCVCCGGKYGLLTLGRSPLQAEALGSHQRYDTQVLEHALFNSTMTVKSRRRPIGPRDLAVRVHVWPPPRLWRPAARPLPWSCLFQHC